MVSLQAITVPRFQETIWIDNSLILTQSYILKFSQSVPLFLPSAQNLLKLSQSDPILISMVTHEKNLFSYTAQNTLSTLIDILKPGSYQNY